MLTSLLVTTPPGKEAVTAELTRLHCRIDTLDDRDLLNNYIATARVMAEGYLSRALITQTVLWTVRPGSSPRERLCGPLELPRAPIQSIASVAMMDDLGNATTIQSASLPVTSYGSFSGYIADLALTPARLRIGRDTALTGGMPLHQTRVEYLQVSMVVGYGPNPEDIPPNIAQAIMMTAAFLYEHRGDEGGGEMPNAVQRLLDRDRLQFLGG